MDDECPVGGSFPDTNFKYKVTNLRENMLLYEITVNPTLG